MFFRIKHPAPKLSLGELERSDRMKREPFTA